MLGLINTSGICRGALTGGDGMDVQAVTDASSKGPSCLYILKRILFHQIMCQTLFSFVY